MSHPPEPLILPWGPEGALSLRPPGRWRVADICEPDRSGILDDYPAALAAALDHVQPGFEEIRGPVALVVDDPSRWTPLRPAVAAMLERLNAAGVPDRDIQICVGVGRHRAADEAAMRRRLGDLIDRIAWHSPPVDDLSAYEDLGRTPGGLPVRVFRPVATSPTRILIGSVLPHLQAGFGGGWKLVFPGCSHRSTLGALHRAGIGPRDQAEGLIGSDPATNPMRQAIAEAARLLAGRTISISHLLGGPDEVLAVAAGSPEEVAATLAAEARRRFQAPFRPQADVVLVGNWPWPGDPLQSFKALLNHRSACRPGGILIGFFWADPAEMDRSMPLRPLRWLARAGRGGAAAVRSLLGLAELSTRRWHHPGSFMIRWARELVIKRQVLVYCPPLVRSVGRRLGPVRLFDRPEDLWIEADRLLMRVGIGDKVRARVFPRGGLTYCRQRPAEVEAEARRGPDQTAPSPLAARA